MIELIVGLVALLAVFAGLVQIASLASAQNDALGSARRQVDIWSMSDVAMLHPPDYIRFWNDGADGKPYTRDDTHDNGNPALFEAAVVDHAVASPADWSLLDAIPNNRLSAIRTATLPQAEFGLIGRTEQRPVALLPAVQSLLYDRSEITVEGTVWAAWTQGIY